MQELNVIQLLIIMAPPLLLAITLHEVAHGWMALRFGDTTAKAQGRLSLNPLRHIDPIGTVLVPALLAVKLNVELGGNGLEWARSGVSLLANPGASVRALPSAYENLQSVIAGNLPPALWPGIVLLAVGAVLALGCWMPRLSRRIPA